MNYLGALSVPGPVGVQGFNAHQKRAREMMDSRDESHFLLMELAAQEPTLQNCFKIIQSTCLAQGLKLSVSNCPPSKKFQEHIDRYYVQFCEQSIRCMFVCGFVPWRLRRLGSGDPVPEVLPLGLFTWSVESMMQSKSASQQPTAAESARKKKQNHRLEAPGSSADPILKDPKSVGPWSTVYERQRRALQRQMDPPDDESTKALRYRISLTENCNVLEDEVEIYEYIQPNRDVTYHSTVYRTVSSPLAHVLNDYRNLRRTMIQREYADTWNTQAKMVCSYASTKNNYNISEGNPISNDWVTPQNRLGLTTDTNIPSEIEQNAYVRDAVTETIVGSKSAAHKPVVFTLPKNTKLEGVQKLETIQDVKEMQVKLAKDITSILGIPYELVGGGYSDKEGKKKSMENTRIFTTNMMNVCKHLECLLVDVYTATYGGEKHAVQFVLRPTPRIEIGSVEEIVMLLEAGVVSYENAMGISNMMLGVDLQQGTGQRATAGGRFVRQYVTPSNMKHLQEKQLPASNK